MITWFIILLALPLALIYTAYKLHHVSISEIPSTGPSGSYKEGLKQDIKVQLTDPLHKSYYTHCINLQTLPITENVYFQQTRISAELASFAECPLKPLYLAVLWHLRVLTLNFKEQHNLILSVRFIIISGQFNQQALILKKTSYERI